VGVALIAVLLCGLSLIQVAVVGPWKPLQVASQLAGPKKFLRGNGNHHASDVTYKLAKELQQDHQQQHEVHKQQQQDLQSLKQQHEQQIQTLSAIQNVQQQIQSDVQKLELLYQQLHSSAAPATSSGKAAQQTRSPSYERQRQQPGNATAEGVVCTVLRNEARYIPEWVAFHLIMGATKIVIYDDNSTDGIREVAAPFGDAVVIVDMKKDVTGVPGDSPAHRVHHRQSKIRL
jgi:Tfp pilus assembly protein PilN